MPDSEPDPVELGVELLSKLEDQELPVASAIDRLETVTTHPRITRQILETAADRGVVERDGSTIRPQGGDYVHFESEVVQKEGEFTCRRCGAELSTGHFIDFDAGELGPFGSTCIRTVTGRE
ncbi:MAG: DUF5830 family protein [Halanaeroarchaeum sp.]